MDMEGILMGTILYDKHGLSIKRFYGGRDRGVCYSFHASGVTELTKDELMELIKVLEEGIIVG
jgi:hypothetical protein